MEKIGVGVIACGKAGQAHMHWYLENKKCQLIGVYDPDIIKARAITKQINITPYNSLDELLQEPKMQLVSIAGPSNFRAEQTIKACQYGKHVIAEKPMANSPEEGKRMLLAAKENNVRLFVYLNMRFHPVTDTIDELIDKIKPIFHIDLQYTQFRTTINWRHKISQKGGVLKEQGVHPIDLALQWCGSVAEVSSETLILHSGREVEDHAVTLLRFKSGATGSIYASYNDRREEAMFGRILGKNGNIIFNLSPYDPEFNKVSLIMDDEKIIKIRKPDVIDPMYPGLLDCNKRAVNHIVDSLITGTPSILDGENGIYPLEIVLASYESQRAHKKIKLPLKSFSYNNIEVCFPRMKF